MYRIDVFGLVQGYTGALFLAFAMMFPESPYFSWFWQFWDWLFSI